MHQSTLPISPVREDAVSAATLRVEVIADFVCPWSFIGKRRLDAALAAVHGPREQKWLPFQINPAMPPEGMLLDTYLSSKFDSSEMTRSGIESLKKAGRVEGINFCFDRIQRVPNTLNAHRLMFLAETEHADTGLIADELMTGFFCRGEDISDAALLISIGEMYGLDSSAVRAALDDDLNRQSVLSQEARMRKSGVAGSPVFLVNNKFLVGGAQSTDTLVAAFDRAMFGEEGAETDATMLH